MNAPRAGPALLWLGPPAAFAYSDDREKAVMQTAVQSYPRRSQSVRFYLAYGATYPLFLAAESLHRWLAGASVEGNSQATEERSVFASARESTFIAISYVLMARTTLRRSARQDRTERSS